MVPELFRHGQEFLIPTGLAGFYKICPGTAYFLISRIRESFGSIVSYAPVDLYVDSRKHDDET